MQEPKLNDLNKSTNTGDTSDSISLISETSYVGNEMDREILMGNDVAAIGRNKHDKAMKTCVKDLSEHDFDSGELKLKKTPQDYAKNKHWIGAKKSMGVPKTKKKLVKRKSKNIERETESDTDSDSETEDKPILRVKRRRKVQEKMKNLRESEKNDTTENDSEDETLDKIAAREIGVKEKNSEQDDKTQHNCTKSKTRDKHIDKRNQLKKLIKIHTDSESSSRYTSFAKHARLKPKNKSQSEHTGHTPLTKMKSKKLTVVDNDSDLSIDDTPLVRKKKSRIQIDTASDSDIGDISVTKTTSVKAKSSCFEQGKVGKKLIVKKKEKDENIGMEKSVKSKYVHSDIDKKYVRRKNIQECSGSTSGDTPLSQHKYKTSKISSSDDNTQRTPLISKTKSKKYLNSDSERSSGDTPLNNKQENARRKRVNSDSDVANTSLMKKEKQKLKSSNELASKTEQRLKRNLKEMKVKHSTDFANDNKTMLAKHSLGEVEETGIVKGAKRNRKLSEISNASSGDIPLDKKLKRQKLDKTSSNANDTQISNDSSCDNTPSVKTKVELRNAKTKLPSKHSSGLLKHKVDEIKQSSEKAEDANAHDSEASEDAIRVTKMKGSLHNAEFCDTNTDNDTLLEVKVHQTKSMTLESSSDEESSIRETDRDKV